jgi:hypothetical protein
MPEVAAPIVNAVHAKDGKTTIAVGMSAAGDSSATLPLSVQSSVQPAVTPRPPKTQENTVPNSPASMAQQFALVVDVNVRDALLKYREMAWHEIEHTASVLHAT